MKNKKKKKYKKNIFIRQKSKKKNYKINYYKHQINLIT